MKESVKNPRGGRVTENQEAGKVGENGKRSKLPSVNQGLSLG